MKGKIIGIVLIVLVIIGLVIFALTRNNGNAQTSNISLFGSELKANDLSIDDFKWEIKPGVHYGEKCYEFILSNNSKYDVIGVQIDYKTKESASEEDLKIFDGFMKEHNGYIKETDSAKDVILRGSNNKLIKVGEKTEGLRFTIGFKNWSWYSYPTDKQFELMEPGELQLGIIGKNKKLYIAYYDFVNKSWTLDDKVVELNTWPENELAKKIKQPNSDYFILRSGKTDEDIDLIIYGTNEEFFKEYVKSAQDNGFTVDAPEKFEHYYSAKNSEGNDISIDFNEEEERIIVYAHVD